jgi:hypothetical protein
MDAVFLLLSVVKGYFWLINTRREKMEIRVGDKVKLRDGYVDASDGSMLTIRVPIGIGMAKAIVKIHSSAVEAVIAHAETDAEKIARLEARVKELESLAVDGPLTKTTNDGKIDGSQPEAPWYPDQLEGYYPWTVSNRIPLGLNMCRTKVHYENGEPVAFCCKLPDQI